MIEIYNEDCFDTMKRMHDAVDLVLTSPPYNMTKRKGGISDSGRYDVYNDWMPEDEYLNFTVQLFNEFDGMLKQNRVILYNFSYSIENPSLPYKLVTKIEAETNFTLVDTIVWKKKSGLPFPANERRLSRLWEYVFVFCRKNEVKTFAIHKGVASVSEKTKQKYYNVFYNFIEARNNDGCTRLNQATFSSDLVMQLLRIYAGDDYIVYDPFIGTGTTAVACKMLGIDCVGSEISKEQCEYAKKRITETREKVVI